MSTFPLVSLRRMGARGVSRVPTWPSCFIKPRLHGGVPAHRIVPRKHNRRPMVRLNPTVRPNVTVWADMFKWNIKLEHWNFSIWHVNCVCVPPESLPRTRQHAKALPQRRAVSVHEDALAMTQGEALPLVKTETLNYKYNRKVRNMKQVKTKLHVYKRLIDIFTHQFSLLRQKFRRFENLLGFFYICLPMWALQYEKHYKQKHNKKHQYRSHYLDHFDNDWIFKERP